MKIGFIGIGKMGEAMVLHALEGGIDVVVYNRTSEKTDELKSKISRLSGIHDAVNYSPPAGGSQTASGQNSKSGKFFPAYSLAELVNELQPPRIIWLMIPQGKPVDEMIEKLLASGVGRGDILIDGGNSYYKDSQRRFSFLMKKGIHYLDIGTSGGLEGARRGACLMIGGEKNIYESLIPLFEKLAVNGGFAYFGGSGSGHFVKMVHNGVEYGMLQSIGEGFELLEKSKLDLDLHLIADNWTKGSVVRGWLMELMERATENDPHLHTIEGVIGGGTTGQWTVDTAKELGVETPAISSSIEAREKSVANPTFSGKVVAALRREFGGHSIVKKALDN